MTKIKIGEADYTLCDGADELSAGIYPHFKYWYVNIKMGIDVPDFHKFASSIYQHYNEGKPADAVVSVSDFIRGMSQLKDISDPFAMAFTMIVYEKDEDTNKWSEGQAKEKLERMIGHGLTQGFIESTVESFFQASSTHFIKFFQESLERLTQDQES